MSDQEKKNLKDSFDQLEKDASGKVDKNKLVEHISDKSQPPENEGYSLPQDDNPVGNAPPAAVQRNTVDHVKRKFEQKIMAL